MVLSLLATALAGLTTLSHRTDEDDRVVKPAKAVASSIQHHSA